MPSGIEIIIIFTAIVLLFGGKKIPELATGLGKGLLNFKKEMKNVENEMKTVEKEVESPSVVDNITNNEINNEIKNKI
jgi:sec-independent protein translocase protein TatA